MGKKLKVSLLIIAGVLVLGVSTVGYKYYGVYQDVTRDPSEIAEEDKIENPFDQIDDGENGEVARNPDGSVKETGTDGENSEAVRNPDGSIKETGADGENGEVVRNPDGSIKETEADGENVDKQSNDVTSGTNVVNGAGTNDKANKGNSSNSQTNNPGYTNTVVPYKQKFQSLESQQEARLGQLINQGKGEYNNARQNNKSVAKIGLKYLREAEKLEAQSDREFNTLKKELEGSLKGNSQDTTIINQLDGYYKQRKSNIRSGVMSKIKGS